MKILLDARLYGLENAGLGRYTMNLIDGLAHIDPKNKYAVLLRGKYFNQLNLPANWTKILADFRHYSVSEQTKLPGMINSLNPDVTHFVHFNIPIFYRGRFVVTIHDLLMQKHRGAKATTLPLYFYYPKQLAAKYVFDRAVRGATRIIVPSRAVKEEVDYYYGACKDKIQVVYDGVDAEKFAVSKDTTSASKYGLSGDYFIYAGNAYPHKNLERAVEAVVLVNKDREKKVFLAIASARSVFTQKLEGMVSRLGAGAYVRLLGFVPDGDLARLYGSSRGFIFPSLSEGFGLPGLEAMAAGTVVLASDIPVFKEVYKSSALYFNPFDFTEIAKTMAQAITMDEGKRQELVASGQKLAKTYPWSKMAEETLKVYESCLSL